MKSKNATLEKGKTSHFPAAPLPLGSMSCYTGLPIGYNESLQVLGSEYNKF
jgi:hypothetical protein